MTRRSLPLQASFCLFGVLSGLWQVHGVRIALSQGGHHGQSGNISNWHFLISYALITSEKIHRTLAAMLGGIVMIILGVVSQETALHHIDFNTLGLLIGMMIMVSITSETGLFKYLAIWAAKKGKGEPVTILIYLALITAFGSALLDNVTTVLLMVPIAFSITRQLQVNPLPYLIVIIITSNIGGTMTMIGDPPNIMIGSAVKELTFMAFINNLSLISIFILIVTLVIFVLIYRKQIQTTRLKAGIMLMDEKAKSRIHFYSKNA